MCEKPGAPWMVLFPGYVDCKEGLEEGMRQPGSNPNSATSEHAGSSPGAMFSSSLELGK